MFAFIQCALKCEFMQQAAVLSHESGISVQKVQEISEAIALQPRQGGLKLRQGHLRSPLVAQHAFEHGVNGISSFLLLSPCFSSRPASRPSWLPRGGSPGRTPVPVRVVVSPSSAACTTDTIVPGPGTAFETLPAPASLGRKQPSNLEQV